MPDDAGCVYSEELCELEADRAATLGVRVVRTFYKWYAWDAEKQVWNWESKKMQACYRRLDRLKNAIFRLRYKLAGTARRQPCRCGGKQQKPRRENFGTVQQGVGGSLKTAFVQPGNHCAGRKSRLFRAGSGI